MKWGSVRLFRVAAAALAAILAACSPTQAPENSPMHTDIEGLARLVALPPSAQSARWQVLQFGEASELGPADWGLAAAFQLPTEIRHDLVAQAAPLAIDRDFPKSFVLSWFPRDLGGLWIPSGAETLRLTARPMDAVAFYKPPLQSGFFLPFGDEGVAADLKAV